MLSFTGDDLSVPKEVPKHPKKIKIKESWNMADGNSILETESKYHGCCRLIPGLVSL